MFFGACPLTFILTEDEDRSTEYIGVSPPCIHALRVIEKLFKQQHKAMSGRDKTSLKYTMMASQLT